jgi:hypothetical protein
LYGIVVGMPDHGFVAQQLHKFPRKAGGSIAGWYQSYSFHLLYIFGGLLNFARSF